MCTTTEIIRDLFGDKRYPKAGWEAFAYYLEEQRGGVGRAFPQFDIFQLWQVIEQDRLDGEWLHSFSDREDVKTAAKGFASKIRHSIAMHDPGDLNLGAL